MLSCKDITELLTEYLDGEMSVTERAQVRIHLAVCRHCRTYVQQLKLTVDSCGRIPAPVLTEELREVLLSTFRDWRAADVNSKV